MEDDLVVWGRVARVETRGRVTGRPARATVGFLERPDGSLQVAASSPRADWALNLLADAGCTVTVGERSGRFRAEELAGPDAARAVSRLILRYGTPAEGLGHGPAFRLRPAESSRGAHRGSGQ